jgi:hypothetical protein
MKLRFRSVMKAPGMATMERLVRGWCSQELFGARVEPDGHGPDGEPSWMLALGMI